MKTSIIRAISIALMLAVLVSVISTTVTADNTVPELSIDGCNLVLKDSVYIKYAVRCSGIDAKKVRVLVWNNGNKKYIRGDEDAVLGYEGKQEIDGKEYAVFVNDNLASTQMADYVYARAYANINGKEYYSDVRKYSVLQYAYAMLGKTDKGTENNNLKNLLLKMLDYGATAQTYFNYNTERLANGNYYQIKAIGGYMEDMCDCGLFAEKETVKLTANKLDKQGNDFAYWKDSAGNKVGISTELDVTVGNYNETYTAVYYVPTAELEYESNGDGTCTVTGISAGSDVKDIVIPSKHGNDTVTEIDVAAFSGEDIKSVTIPSTVKYIGKKAFNNCDELTDVYYLGTKEEWDKISIADYNAPLTDNDKIIYAGEASVTVIFKDYDGKILKKEVVYSGGSATPPENPMREGYTFAGWSGSYQSVTADTVVTAMYEKEASVTSFAVSNTSARAGDKNVEVIVSLRSNPGFLTMAVKIDYNSENMTLVEVSNGTGFSGYNFTAPKNMKSGCTAGWYSTDLPSQVVDGDILVLKFAISDTAVSGEYDIAVSCPAGDMVDGNKKPIDVVSSVGKLTVN